MNMFLHDFGNASIAIGDTMRKPAFAAEGAGLKQFRYVTANPMWNQKNYTGDFYENDPYLRFTRGAPPDSSADWGWVQHMAASLDDQGRAAIVLDTGAVSRGSGSKSNNKEKTIRQAFVEADWIEGVILLPENLFYNTTAPGIILLLNKAKPAERRGEILLVERVQLLRQGEAEERPDRRGHRRRGRGLPQVGDAGEAEPGHHAGRGAGGGLQLESVVVCGGWRRGAASSPNRHSGRPGSSAGRPGVGGCAVDRDLAAAPAPGIGVDAMIQRIEAVNYRSLRFISQDLLPFQVLVGPNASGKSTFLDVVALLGDFVRYGLDEALLFGTEPQRGRARSLDELIFNQAADGFELAIESGCARGAAPGTAQRRGRVAARYRPLRGGLRQGRDR